MRFSDFSNIFDKDQLLGRHAGWQFYLTISMTWVQTPRTIQNGEDKKYGPKKGKKVEVLSWTKHQVYFYTLIRTVLENAISPFYKYLPSLHLVLREGEREVIFSWNFFPLFRPNFVDGHFSQLHATKFYTPSYGTRNG